ncbi:hypothetical protein P3T37_006859 [Kitasatospora sp. MAA4]|uniref:hypothetical protein n=1 Tax=Kitasatospora sp. MAA4 TaxID=3035093 RepID=UPI0024737D3A|nr:hypothetical protein [Kitasatospora sp. MAA4]MDH6137427.1 hypothetical protein [Kitasatospora sp. MAA4]
MDTLIFSIPRRQARSIFVRQALLAIFFCTMATLRLHRTPVFTIGIDLALLVLLALAIFGQRITLSGGGIQIRHFFLPATVRPWSDITSIHEERVRNVLVLKVRTTDGKERRLPHPMSNATKSDPEYYTQRDQIIAFWRQHAVTPNAR